MTGSKAAASGRRAGCPFRLEADLYEPVKRFLEERGYEVKGEVGGCDVVAVRRGGPTGEPPVVVELKLAFTLLSLVLQGIDRLAVTDLVYLALPAAGSDRPVPRASFSTEHSGVCRLCRRLGLGLLAVHPPPGPDKDGAAAAPARVEVVLDPVP
jgi:hypothetical protein